MIISSDEDYPSVWQDWEVTGNHTTVRPKLFEQNWVDSEVVVGCVNRKRVGFVVNQSKDGDLLKRQSSSTLTDILM